METGEREDWRKNHFATYLRTGRRIEVKFNPNHDPRNGRFTFKDGGSIYQDQQVSPGAFQTDRGSTDRHDGGFQGGGGGTFGGAGATGHGDWPKPPSGLSLHRPRFRTKPEALRLGKSLDRNGVARSVEPTTLRQSQGSMVGPVIKPSQVRGAPKTLPSTSHEFRRVAKNGYDFGLDPADRTREAKGELHFATGQARSRTNQRQAGGVDRRHTDDGGHFIAARVDGPTDRFNHFAQDANFNRGGYRAIENEWAKDLRAGRRVSVDITAHYPGSSQRPDSLTVKWSIDGHQRSRHFPNEAKGKKHDR